MHTLIINFDNDLDDSFSFLTLDSIAIDRGENDKDKKYTGTMDRNSDKVTIIRYLNIKKE